MADRNTTPAKYNRDTAGAPFDEILRTDQQGEYWLARELMPLLGYDQWRRFTDAISRAQLSAANTGLDAGREFMQVSQVVGAGNLGDQQRGDYRLTRYACYLVAINSDPRKPEIAAAQTYFAVRTREAEVAEAEHDELPEWARQQIDTIRRVGKIETEQRRQGQRLTDVETRVNELEAAPGWFTALGYARLKELATSPNALRLLGRTAAKVCKEHGISPEKATDTRYGEVGVYPKAVLDEAADRIAARAA